MSVLARAWRWWRGQVAARGAGKGDGPAGTPASSLADGVVVIAGVVLRRGTKAADVAAVARLDGACDVDGTAFDATAHFEDGRLSVVDLIVADPEIAGTSWHDWRGDRARAFHDAFLAERFGRGDEQHADSYPYGSVEYRMRWGTLGSYLPPQDRWARIGLYYR